MTITSSISSSFFLEKYSSPTTMNNLTKPNFPKLLSRSLWNSPWWKNKNILSQTYPMPSMILWNTYWNKTKSKKIKYKPRKIIIGSKKCKIKNKALHKTPIKINPVNYLQEKLLQTLKSATKSLTWILKSPRNKKSTVNYQQLLCP